MTKTIATLTFAALAGLVLAGCAGGTTIHQAGSSTVLPLAERWAEEFGARHDVQIIVSGGGSGAGATQLCDGSIQLGDMSRAMRDTEKATCRANGVEPVEWIVAFDGLSVVVSTANTFVQDLTIEELALMFGADAPATNWRQVKPSYPNAPISLCYPDADSGTYEYFGEAVLGEEEPRTGNDVQQSSNDNDLVKCLESNANAIGYFGYAYVQRNSGVRAVAVEGVLPSTATIADGSYTPLSRPLFIYSDGVPTSGVLYDYFHYVLHEGQDAVETVGYVPLDPETLGTMRAQLG